MWRWNLPNILSNIDRLRYHLGIPMGKFITCPVFRQDKLEIYKHLDNFAAPTLGVTLLEEDVSDIDLARINRFRYIYIFYILYIKFC